MSQEYIDAQNKWIEAIGGIKAGDEFLVISTPESGIGGWEGDGYSLSQVKIADWVGKVGNLSKVGLDAIDSNSERVQSMGIALHRYGGYCYFPFWCLVKR